MKTLEATLASIEDVFVIDRSITYDHYIQLDLSESNPHIAGLDTANPIEFDAFIGGVLKSAKARVGIGRYNEIRNIYKRSENFNSGWQNERNIHIGVDLMVPASTAVLAALDGVVHSFKNNSAVADYGPTIILKHEVDSHVFHTLYGHLSLDSIGSLKVGDNFAKSQEIGRVGDFTVNGEWPPHLHFQVIIDMNGNEGDYPGVCSKGDLPDYLKNCPNPGLLLRFA